MCVLVQVRIGSWALHGTLNPKQANDRIRERDVLMAVLATTGGRRKKRTVNVKEGAMTP